ncbi:MAG: hypothetical protein HRK26_04990 [Rickettsiaceae bacterium H1]|nr:hypothetical protein [Rickettsiaceae bacterium H1]
MVKLLCKGLPNTQTTLIGVKFDKGLKGGDMVIISLQHYTEYQERIANSILGKIFNVNAMLWE